MDRVERKKDKIVIVGVGTTCATTNKIVIQNSCLETLIEIEVNDDGSGLVIGTVKDKTFSVRNDKILADG